MAHPSKINSSTGLAFILGAIVIAIAGLAYAIFASDADISVSIEGEDTTLEKAAEAISGG